MEEYKETFFLNAQEKTFNVRILYPLGQSFNYKGGKNRKTYNKDNENMNTNISTY